MLADAAWAARPSAEVATRPNVAVRSARRRRRRVGLVRVMGVLLARSRTDPACLTALRTTRPHGSRTVVRRYDGDARARTDRTGRPLPSRRVGAEPGGPRLVAHAA